MNNTIEHQKFCDDLLFEFGSRPDVRLFSKVVGTFRSMDGNRIISVGIKGETDLWGFVMPRARYLAIEVKTGNAVRSKQQIKWGEMILSFGGIYIVARSVIQAKEDFNLQYGN